MRFTRRRMMRQAPLSGRALAVKDAMVEAFSRAADPSIVLGEGTAWSIDSIRRIASDEFGIESLPEQDARQTLSLALTFEERGGIPAIDTVRETLKAILRSHEGKGPPS